MDFFYFLFFSWILISCAKTETNKKKIKNEEEEWKLTNR